MPSLLPLHDELLRRQVAQRLMEKSNGARKTAPEAWRCYGVVVAAGCAAVVVEEPDAVVVTAHHATVPLVSGVVDRAC